MLHIDVKIHIFAEEHPDLEGSWRFVRTLILSNKFVLVEPCLPSFQDERRGKVAMRFVPKALRDYFLARCFTRYMKEKRIIGLPLAEEPADIGGFGSGPNIPKMAI
eukprot:s2022_g3.t1